MRHFYIYKPTKNLSSFETEGVRSGFFYIGEYHSEPYAYKNLRSRILHLIDTNNMIREQLELEEVKFHGIDEVSNYDLVSIFVDQYEINTELLWSLRMKE